MATITANTAVLQPSGLSSFSSRPVNAVRRSVTPINPTTTQVSGFMPTPLVWPLVTSARRIVYPKPNIAVIGGAYVVPPTSGTMKFQWG